MIMLRKQRKKIRKKKMQKKKTKKTHAKTTYLNQRKNESKVTYIPLQYTKVKYTKESLFRTKDKILYKREIYQSQNKTKEYVQNLRKKHIG